MSVDTPFYFLDQVRSSYFWSSPNQAGAFIACLIPLLWWVRSDEGSWLGQTLLLLVEIVLLWLLARTFSRGAVCALAAALGYTVCLRSSESRSALRWLAIRSAVAILILAVSGIWGRVVTAGTDASVTNRWAVYQGGVQMIADAPLGWGAGESGFAFSNWYQSAAVDIRYLGMVSSVLEIGVERGLPVLTGLLVAVTLSIALPFMLWARRSTPVWRLPAIAGGVTVAWFVNACFSTITDAPSLWLPLAFGLATSISVLFLSSYRPTLRLLFRRVPTALLVSGALGGMVFAAGWTLARKRALSITAGPGQVEITRDVPGIASVVLYFLPDPAVLGDTWGKELRVAVRQSAYSLRAIVLDPRIVTPSPAASSPSAPLFLFGTFCAPTWVNAESVVLICPSRLPPLDPLPSVKALCLPAWDELGHREAWMQWAGKNGVPVVEAPDCGQDVRGAWSFIFDSLVHHVSGPTRPS